MFAKNCNNITEIISSDVRGGERVSATCFYPKEGILGVIFPRLFK